MHGAIGMSRAGRTPGAGDDQFFRDQAEHEKQKDISTELLVAVREILRMAIMTLAALRDPDQRYLGWSQMPGYVVNSIHEAYGYASASIRGFRPSPAEVQQMERVAPWLSWMRRTYGELALRRFIGWSMGVPAWRLAQREKCSERTIMNRIDRTISGVILQFTGANLPVEEIEEPYKGVAYAIIFERPDSTSTGEVKPMKIYVGGMGFYRTRGDGRPGRWLRNTKEQVAS